MNCCIFFKTKSTQGLIFGLYKYLGNFMEILVLAINNWKTYLEMYFLTSGAGMGAMDIGIGSEVLSQYE